jgi:hypothetical protein
MAATTLGPHGQNVRRLLCAAAASLILAGCVQSTANSPPAIQPGPVAAPVTTGEPVVLSGAYMAQEQAQGAASVPPTAAPATMASSDPAPPARSPDPVIAPALSPPPVQPSVQSPPIAAAPPPQVTAPAPQAATPPPPVASTRADGYPNINIPPAQPGGGKLLSAEERAKLIAELNALASRHNR